MPTQNIDVSTPGDNVIVDKANPVPEAAGYPALKSNQQVVVLHFWVTSTSAGGTVTQWKSQDTGKAHGTVGSTDISGGGLAVPYAKDGLFRTDPGHGLVLNLAAGVRITGLVEYAIVPGFSQLSS